MTKRPKHTTPVKKHHARISRRILVAAHEAERRPILEDVKLRVRTAKDNVLESAESLRREQGISLPTMAPEWDIVPTAQPSPSQTIEAFDGNRSEIRITLHLDSLLDDTTTVELEGFGISHLIGISTGDLKNTWRESKGGMIAVIHSNVGVLSELLHDILLDMAMVHARAKPWSNLREQLSSHSIAALKADFVRETGLLAGFPYKPVGDSRYFPLASFARIRSNESVNSRFQLDKYVELWFQFAHFVRNHPNVTLDNELQNTANQFLKSHINTGQISPSKLETRTQSLQPGHYCFYFLMRKARNRMKVAELCSFFGVSKESFRTQLWVIYPRDEKAKEASVFVSENYVSVFPFYVG
jgi:hypothetical protein